MTCLFMTLGFILPVCSGIGFTESISRDLSNIKNCFFSHLESSPDSKKGFNMFLVITAAFAVRFIEVFTTSKSDLHITYLMFKAFTKSFQALHFGWEKNNFLKLLPHQKISNYKIWKHS